MPDPDRVGSRAEFGAAITTLREQADLSIRDLGRRIGIHPSTLGGYFSGRNLPTPAQMPAVREMLRSCGVPDGELDRWAEAVRRLRAVPAGDSRRPSPYPGLSSFDVDDSAVFFGRASETADVLIRLDALRTDPGPSRGMVAVIGPSGSGKSSLLRAGVAAALQRDGSGWTCAVMTPGDEPAAALDAARTAFDPGDRVLIVDQFEEAFTEADAAARAGFLTELATLAPDVLVVLGMRADFYAAAAREPVLVPALQHAQVVVGPLDHDALRLAVGGPAQSVGVAVEEALVDLVLADLAPRGAHDAAHDAGALPLLSHALRSAWERGTGRTLRIAEYRAAGGIDGAVQRSAEEGYAELDPSGQDAARALFLRLVHIGDEVAVTRRRVAGGELAALQEADPELTGLVRGLVERRLLTATADSLEISHEALLSAWPRLRDWVDDDRAGLRLHRTVTESANVWDDGGRDDALLLRGGRLEAAAELAANPTPRTGLNVLEHKYVAAGVASRDAERNQSRRRTRRLRRLLAAVAVLALIAAGLAFYSLRAQSSADTAEGRARTARDEALSRQIAGRARELRDSDPALAQQLALVAYREASSDDARGALIDQSSQPSITRVLGAQGPTPLALSHDGRTIAVAHADDGTVRLYRRTSAVPTEIGEIPAHSLAGDAGKHQVFALGFSPDGHLLATGGESRTVRLWDVTAPATPQLVSTIATGFTGDVQDATFSPDGTKLLVSGTGPHGVQVWNVADARAPRALTVPKSPGATVTVLRARFSPDGRSFAANGRDDRTVRVWPISGDRVGAPRTRNFGDQGLYGLCWLPDGRTLLVATKDGTVLPLDARTLGSRAKPIPVSTGQAFVLTASPDGSRFAAGSSDNEVSQWSTSTWGKLSSLGNPGPITGVAYSPDGATLVTSAADGTMRLYAADSGMPSPDAVFTVGFSRDGSRFVAASSGGVQIMDTRDIARPRPVSHVRAPGAAGNSVGTVGLRPDGRMVAGGTDDGHLVLWDLADAARPRMVGEPVQVLEPGNLTEGIAFAPSGRWLAVGGDDNTVRVLDVATPTRPRTTARLDAHGLVLGVAISPDGRYLAAACADNHGYLWDVSTPERPRLVARLGGFASYAYAVGFSPRSDRIAVGSADHTVRLWRLRGASAPTPIGRPLIGPSDYVYATTFSPDGTHLAVSSSDHTVRIFDVAGTPQRTPEETLEAIDGNVFAAVYSPDGSRLVGAGRAAAMAVWSTDVASYRARLCGVAGSPITRDEWALYVPGTPYDPPCR